MADASPQVTDEQWLDLNRGVIEEFRANAGVCGGRWEGNPMVLLTTIGARSGVERVSPVTYTTTSTEAGEAIVLIASKAGNDRHPGWYHNLVANPEVVIEVGAERFAATARTADEPERTRLFDERIAVMPRFGDYTKKTDRTIPVVVVERGSD
jgi:deazaflavin-dependent oxidoreductase (nitroreductase family)